jgi:hypothetical protein
VSRTVYLHVGTAKSGTTYVQRVLARNRKLLQDHGLLYPGDRSSHFWESMDLRGAGFKGYEYPEAQGAWDRVVAEVEGFAGDVLISHESLANTPPKLIQKAVESFPGREVRVLVTCRDLGRLVPAAWQEAVKNRNQQTYGEYLDMVFDSWNDGDTVGNAFFWRAQNLIALVRRWSAVVGAENIRLVTVPAPGTDPDELWRRFQRAADLPELEYDVAVSASNASLGTAETELLRRMQPHFPDELTWPMYERRIKGRFVRTDLSLHTTGGKLTVPEKYREQADRIADQMIGAMRDSGCTVVGDLEDLRPAYLPVVQLPDDVSTEQLLELSLRLIAGMASRRPPVVQNPAPRKGTARLLAGKVVHRLRSRTR